MNKERRAVWSWAFVDWGNSAFAIVVMTAFFPAFFERHWANVAGMPTERKTFYLTIALSVSSIVIAVMAPLLGSIADQGNAKKKFLAAFTVLGVVATAAIPLAAQGQYVLAATLYAVAMIGFSGNITFYDALLTDVAGPSKYDRVSALGYALGYIGSGVLFVACSVVLADPAKFGLESEVQAMSLSFWVTAAWWLLFTIPCLLWVRETPGVPAAGGGSVVARGFRQFITTARAIRHDRRLLLFLAAYILYIDGVNTVMKVAMPFALGIGLELGSVLKALVVIQFVGFPAAIVFGRIGERIGPQKGIMIAIVTYTVVCIYATRIRTEAEFFVMAMAVGLVQGGVQSLSRSYFARLIPAEKGGEYFGFYNMLGKFAAILGPALYGTAALFVGVQTAILSLIVLFAAGAWVLSRVPKDDSLT